MIPGLAQVIGANESFYKTAAEFGLDEKDYRAMAELAGSEQFVKKWRADYDSYLAKALLRAIVNPLKKKAVGRLKDAVSDVID